MAAALAGLWGPGTGPGAVISKLGGAPAAFTAATGVPYYIPLVAIVVVLVVVAIIIIYSISAANTAPAVSVEGPIDLFSVKDLIIVDRTTARNVLKNSYTIAFFLNITAVPDMRVAATPLLTWPGVWNLGYTAAQEQLVWTMYPYPDADGIMSPTLTLPLANVPMQKWTQIVVTCEGRTMDFYVNGSLSESFTLSNLPLPPTASITKIPNGVMGQAAYIQTWPRRLTMGEVADNYTSVSDSQGRPLLTKSLFSALFAPNLFCPSGDCAGSSPTASPSQIWEFPYQ
jgi:hypothetical protein